MSELYAQPSPSKSPRLAEVMEELEGTKGKLNDLNVVIEDLARRLEIVLQPTLPSSDHGAQPAVETCGSPLGRELQEINGRLDIHMLAIRMLMERMTI